MKSAKRYNMFAAVAGTLILLWASKASAADTDNKIPVIPGETYKFSGVVDSVSDGTFVLLEGPGREIEVLLVRATQIKEKKKNPFRGARWYSEEHLTRGLLVEVKGRADGYGRLVAKEIKFTDRQYEIASLVESRVNPVESSLAQTQSRLSQSEDNARRLSDQVVELNTISNSARGEARTAQNTADTALEGLSAANHAISELDMRTGARFLALDEYDELGVLTVKFQAGSTLLSDRAKERLDDFAFEAKMEKGYVIEVVGYASSDGDISVNKRLSRQRALAVVDYLIEVPGIPLRRVISPFGYGEKMPIADNSTVEGRRENRRVELKILVSRGMTEASRMAAASGEGN